MRMITEDSQGTIVGKLGDRRATPSERSNERAIERASARIAMTSAA